MEIRGILFDKDGTLFDFDRTWGRWFDCVISELAEGDIVLKNNLARSCGYDLLKQEFVAGSLIVIGTSDEVNAALAMCLPTKTIAQVDAIARQYLAKLPYAPVCDLRQLMIELRALNYVVGLATNDYLEGAKKQVQDAGISDLFDFICGSDSGYGGKPGAGMIDAFCDQTGVDCAKVAVVGDSVHDLVAGAAAGVGMRIGVLTGPARRDELSLCADVVLDDISQLMEPDIQCLLRS